MALFTHINGTQLNEVVFNDLRGYLQQHIFYGFMDGGRKGLQDSLWDAFCTIEKWQNLRNNRKQTPHNKGKAAAIFREAEEKLMNDFITKGTGTIGETLCMISVRLAE